MAERRPDKDTVRRLWLEVILVEAGRADRGLPVYLTLGGAEGVDIGLALDAGVAKRTEVGGIATEDDARIVAVESNLSAVLSLQRRYPGLRILEMPIQNLLKGQSLLRWPQGDELQFCRARVINLDINEALRSVDVGGEHEFPLLNIVYKLAAVHGVTPKVDWVLLLTIPADFAGAQEGLEQVRAFLAENCENDPAFSNQCRSVLGDDLHGAVLSGLLPASKDLSPNEKQLLLMAFVPKKIASLVVGNGWRVEIARNLRYGGNAQSAHMVTWIIRFVSDKRSKVKPGVVYKESLQTVFQGVGQVEADGSVH